jgi:hypothetical protein
MLWNCPVCSLATPHTAIAERPVPGARYYCHVCRLDLVFDPSKNRMALPPIGEDRSSPRQSEVKRRPQ